MKKAFHFIIRNGYPVCFLRPVLSKRLGHCFFAYPLYTGLKSDQEMNMDISTDEHHMELDSARKNIEQNKQDSPPSYEEVMKDRSLMSFEDVLDLGLFPGLDEKVLQSTDFNITEEEELRNKSNHIMTGSEEKVKVDSHKSDIAGHRLKSRRISSQDEMSGMLDDDESSHANKSNQNQNQNIRMSSADSPSLSIQAHTQSVTHSSMAAVSHQQYANTLYENIEEREGSSPTQSSSFEGWQDVEAVYNSQGRQALGCLFGKDYMPTLCTTFPVAAELSQADFWHVRRNIKSTSDVTIQPHGPVNADASGERSTVVGHGDAVSGLGVGPQEDDLDASWIEEEVYVALHSTSCEGFSVDRLQPRTPIENGMYLHNPDRAPGERMVTVREFLYSNVKDTSTSNGKEDGASGNGISKALKANKVLEMHWFIGLIDSTSKYLPPETIVIKELKTRFLNVLAKIWYNFDSLASTKTRQIKSYGRLKRDINTLTWVLVRETKKFIDTYVANYNNRQQQQQQHDLSVENFVPSLKSSTTHLSSSISNNEDYQKKELLIEYEKLILRLNI